MFMVAYNTPQRRDPPQDLSTSIPDGGAAPNMNNELIAEIKAELEKRTEGELKTDAIHRILYSTDASIYQIPPLAVFFPKRAEDVLALVSLAAEFRLPLIARGAGTSLAGQAIGPGIVVDFSRYLQRTLHIDPERREAEVDPGVVINRLNREAAKYRLHFAPDPASSDRATLGGSLANNAAGAHSILYGMAVDHVLSLDVVLADGSLARFQEVSLEEARHKASAGHASIEARLYAFALDLRARGSQMIQSGWPRTWRTASGYNLNYLLPWSPSRPPMWPAVMDMPYPPIAPDRINLSHVFVGAEGTLGMILKARVRLLERLTDTYLVLVSFEHVVAACEAVVELFALAPYSIELVPRAILQLAASIPAYARQLRVLDALKAEGQFPEALLVIEIPKGNTNVPRELERLRAGRRFVLEIHASQEKEQVWNIRKVGLGLLLAVKGDVKPWAFIEDMAVPVEQLGHFVRQLDEIFSAFGVRAEFYAHASAGCLHIRPMINLKTTSGVQMLRAISQEAMQLVAALGGAPSGEHGDGLARTEWLPQTFGAEIYAAFRTLKQCADAHNLFNPGKIVSPHEADELPRMDTHLRYASTYQPQAWASLLQMDEDGGLIGAIEQCNGAGVCRKEEGVMCPSFMASGDELLSTRGRANLLRAWLLRDSMDAESREILHQALFNTLSQCLACKGCKAECPSGVDMARLKVAFLEAYYRQRRHPLRDYFFAYVATWARWGCRIVPLLNLVLHEKVLGRWIKRWLKITPWRRLPRLARRPLSARIAHSYTIDRRNSVLTSSEKGAQRVWLLVDAFTEYFYPEIGLEALFVLQALGFEVARLPMIGAGRTLFSKGFVAQARRQAHKLLAYLQQADGEGEGCIVGFEPSELSMLRDEYALFFDAERVDEIARLGQRVYGIEDFLVRVLPQQGHLLEKLRIAVSEHPKNTVLVHAHCHQKSEAPHPDGQSFGAASVVELLRMLGFRVEALQGSCCGMAGSFGYELEHDALSRRIGEMSLRPLLRDRLDERTILVSSGVSCRTQIADLSGQLAVHPIELIAELFRAARQPYPSSKISM